MEGLGQRLCFPRHEQHARCRRFFLGAKASIASERRQSRGRVEQRERWLGMIAVGGDGEGQFRSQRHADLYTLAIPSRVDFRLRPGWRFGKTRSWPDAANFHHGLFHEKGRCRRTNINKSHPRQFHSMRLLGQAVTRKTLHQESPRERPCKQRHRTD